MWSLYWIFIASVIDKIFFLPSKTKPGFNGDFLFSVYCSGDFLHSDIFKTQTFTPTCARSWESFCIDFSMKTLLVSFPSHHGEKLLIHYVAFIIDKKSIMKSSENIHKQSMEKLCGRSQHNNVTWKSYLGDLPSSAARSTHKLTQKKAEWK